MAMGCMMLSGCAGNASTDGEAHSGASVESSGESVTTSVESEMTAAIPKLWMVTNKQHRLL